MARAQSVYELIEFPKDQFQFPFPGWEREFGLYNWFYVTDTEYLLSNAKIFEIGVVEKCRNMAIQNCPEKWKSEFPMGDWNHLAPNQISRMLKSRALRFDKACLGILCMEAAVLAKNPEVDIYEYAKILPAVFVVDGLDEVVRQSSREIMQRAAEHIRQSTRFVEQAGREGLAMTYRSASSLVEFLNERGYRRCEVRMIFDRTDRGKIRVKRPLEERLWD